MHFTDEAVQILARQVYGEGSGACDRANLEAALVPMIRVALRTGRGQPVLVRWVQSHLAAVAASAEAGRNVDAEWAAPRMARLLCSQMLEHVRAEVAWAGGRETVVGR